MTFPWLEFAGLMLAFGINAVIPGADFAMVLRQSVVHGRRAALFTSAGVATSILVHGSYTLLGVGVLVGQSLLAFNILKWAGAAYLVWLAIAALRSPPPQPPSIAEGGESPRGDMAAFALGFLTNLLNPKAVLFFLALFTSLVSVHTAGNVKVIYVASMSIMLFAWFALVSVFFTTHSVRQGFFRVGRWFNRVTGITFLALAVRVALAQQR
ncbi:LysE family translocator [Devosia sp. 63-57]|uniref:LysE family translocator n=1 Tax=Devosia sp. 63-57 TaxID=1895751 RepID=UPI000869B4FF|nr:LysE family translocator [Devosia sp. 63-57]ODT50824.1 MAG: lysine transporter LysE [Pelagibacterium sp. SCN 63-126]ODU82439.1 MAG: lysine transporter LysE [Pelagibacterium sp. SCN 63-17]OJX44514.1 MAG: lysine transporter LysE [Devosia sp. 63-57]